MIKNIFYDLDGTLLPMDMDEFTNFYFVRLVKKTAPYGYEAESMIANIWKGTRAMVLNDGTKTNEEAFWDDFTKNMGKPLEDKAIFTDFYANEFNEAIAVVHPDERIPKLIKTVKAMGFTQTLATNPIFPEVATVNRIRWAGLDREDFTTFTTYEHCRYCKPTVNYYLELCKELGFKPEETLMVGNDVDEDMIAETIGMKVFLITAFMLNKHNKDINLYPHGDWDDLLEYIKHIND